MKSFNNYFISGCVSNLDLPVLGSFYLHLFFFYKQLGSDPSPQSCLYFQGFWGSKLLNQGLSQNLKQVPQNFMKVFNTDDITLTS